MNKNYNIVYNIVWTVVPLLFLFANISKEYAANPLVWLGVGVWVTINIILIIRSIYKSDAQDSTIQLKSDEIIEDFSNITKIIDGDIAELIKPLNDGKPVREQKIEKGWLNVHNAFSYRDNMIFRAKSRIMFSFGSLEPTSMTVLIQAFPLTDTDDYDKIVRCFLSSYSKKMKTDFTKNKLQIKNNEWSLFSFKSPENKKHHIDILIINKNNYLHTIVFESKIGYQMNQLLMFLSSGYKN